ncbi:MarR family winged helix-turn-helix transcriptional regulator [Actinoplanes rectilineatus]|uniref:MarR family winged helix-turn-helix transcriptional regulator n=1 Tax=Actinoplanes rectilineatus TaxID=113571 RepID=UPI0005F2D46B|nr:MarR family transcriptional regulator [Actinoplanes rectilineatus]
MATHDDDLAEELRAAVGEFVRRVRDLSTMPAGQAAVLGHLVRRGPLAIADLARLEDVRHQSMTRTVGLLADQHLITLGAAEDDRRRVVVTITDSGLARLHEQRQARAAWIATAMETLGPDDRTTAARIPAILRALTAN